MKISNYAKLIFKHMHSLQEKPKARYVREKVVGGSPLTPSQKQIILDLTIPVLYSETEILINDYQTVVPKVQMFFYIQKSNLPDNTKPVVGDKIIYEDRTYQVKQISEIANVIYKLNVDYI